MENPLYDVLGDRRAKPGTEAFAKWWRSEITGALKDSDVDIRRVATELSLGAKYECWKLLRNADGLPFDGFDDFCEAAEPYGCGKPAKLVKALLAALHGDGRAAALVAGRAPTHAQVSAQQVKKGHKNFQPKEKTAGASDPSDPKDRYGETSEYLAARIARDAPEVHARMKAGEFKSVRAAAVAAGLVKPVDPVKKARVALRKLPTARVAEVTSVVQLTIERMSRAEQVAIRDWLVALLDGSP